MLEILQFEDPVVVVRQRWWFSYTDLHLCVLLSGTASEEGAGGREDSGGRIGMVC